MITIVHNAYGSYVNVDSVKERLSALDCIYAVGEFPPSYPVPAIRLITELFPEEVCIWEPAIRDHHDDSDHRYYGIVKSWDRGEEHPFDSTCGCCVDAPPPCLTELLKT